MKRMICLILALALVFTMAACGSKEEPVVTTATEVTVEMDEAVAPETTEATEPEVTEPPMDLPALVNDENVTFIVGHASSNDMAGMEMEVTCVNKTQEKLVFSWNDVPKSLPQMPPYSNFSSASPFLRAGMGVSRIST